MRWRTGRSLRRALTLLAAISTTPATAQTLYTWPGPPPCDGTLQACISAALPEDAIEIATNAPIDEDISSQGSLDLHAAPGFRPVFAAGSWIEARASASGGTQSIRVEGLTLLRGHLQVIHSNNPGMLTVRIIGNTIVTPDQSIPMSLLVFASGNIDFAISGNRVTTDLFQNYAISVSSQETLAFGTVADNVVTMPTNNDAVGIGVVTEDGGLFLDVVRNRVEGLAYLEGIALRRYGTGGIAARVFGNLVRGATAGGAGIVLEANSVDPGSTDGQIVNNTVDGNWKGIKVYAPDVLVANNAVTGSIVAGLEGSSSNGFVTTRNNLFHGNALDVDGPPVGPGTLFANPLYLGSGNFRLAATSPAIDAGDSADVAPEFDTDLDGAARIAGVAVDIGAYEVPEPSLPGAGFAALLALALRWRSLRSRQLLCARQGSAGVSALVP